MVYLHFPDTAKCTVSTNTPEKAFVIRFTQHMSAVLVTHDISEAISFCDRIIVLTSRPASVKKTFDIHLTLDEDRTPFKARMAPEFKDYFNEIWGELNV